MLPETRGLSLPRILGSVPASRQPSKEETPGTAKASRVGTVTLLRKAEAGSLRSTQHPPDQLGPLLLLMGRLRPSTGMGSSWGPTRFGAQDPRTALRFSQAVLPPAPSVSTSYLNYLLTFWLPFGVMSSLMARTTFCVPWLREPIIYSPIHPLSKPAVCQEQGQALGKQQ